MSTIAPTSAPESNLPSQVATTTTWSLDSQCHCLRTNASDLGSVLMAHSNAEHANQKGPIEDCAAIQFSWRNPQHFFLDAPDATKPESWSQADQKLWSETKRQESKSGTSISTKVGSDKPVPFFTTFAQCTQGRRPADPRLRYVALCASKSATKWPTRSEKRGRPGIEIGTPEIPWIACKIVRINAESPPWILT